MGRNPSRARFVVWLAAPSLKRQSTCQPHNIIRTLPPEVSREYAAAHDAGMWRTAVALLGETPGTADELQDTEQIASHPMRMGGLGFMGGRTPHDQPAQSTHRCLGG